MRIIRAGPLDPLPADVVIDGPVELVQDAVAVADETVVVPPEDVSGASGIATSILLSNFPIKFSLP